MKLLKPSRRLFLARAALAAPALITSPRAVEAFWQSRDSNYNKNIVAAGGTGNQWNVADKDASITLSGSPLLTATATSAAFWNGVRAVDSASSGKFFWEYTFNTSPGSDAFIVGFANSTAAVSSSIIGNDNNGFSYDAGSAQIRLNGVITSIQSAVIADTASIAVDFTAQKFWLSVVSFIGSSIGGWNNDILANQNPATGTGGISFATMAAGPYFAAASMILTVATNMTANFGQSTYVRVAAGGSVPTGFSDWS